MIEWLFSGDFIEIIGRTIGLAWMTLSIAAFILMALPQLLSLFISTDLSANK